eukprot:gnl/TRDRNA2_/TRDRNA2_182677_c0_seq1.p2 gnl/TRDRNA2_/TRDRNA2_182677_c0~~gnl/TRDRNA2_/TRDRNA2_182677_c0_seq1.p2  ORF type:complete len:164 (+),score=28.09 gnl/TRDRNA2_/TRDRNA2_182677_c0_seq1:67-558(+)
MMGLAKVATATVTTFVALVVVTPPVYGSLLRGFPQKAAPISSPPVPSGGSCKGCNEEREKLEIFDSVYPAVPFADPTLDARGCFCTSTADEACSCTGCTDEQQQDWCEELLGPCTCQYQDPSAICDCHGYCHTAQERKDACEDEAGCQWMGMWCEAEIGLVWE